MYGIISAKNKELSQKIMLPRPRKSNKLIDSHGETKGTHVSKTTSNGKSRYPEIIVNINTVLEPINHWN